MEASRLTDRVCGNRTGDRWHRPIGDGGNGGPRTECSLAGRAWPQAHSGQASDCSVSVSLAGDHSVRSTTRVHNSSAGIGAHEGVAPVDHCQNVIANCSRVSVLGTHKSHARTPRMERSPDFAGAVVAPTLPSRRCGTRTAPARGTIDLQQPRSARWMGQTCLIIGQCTT